MKVLVASKALVVGAYQRKLEEIASQPGVARLVAVVPPAWQEPGGRTLRLERFHTAGYELRVEPIRFNGSFHLFFWPGLGRVLREVRPDVVHVDEEPYNLATALATWQNLLRRYPPPFSLFERYVFQASAHALVGNREAEGVIRAKGYRGPATYIPQFGVDPDLFAPRDRARTGPSTVGFVGRLVEEKGILFLLDALRALPGDWRLQVVGSGPLKDEAMRRAATLGLKDRVTWHLGVASNRMPELLRSLDVLVLPSLTRPHWKEQFGRVLVEAMACEVPVVGSSCGEIPNVLGDAGIVTPEADAGALRDALARLLADASLCQQLGKRGRERVLTHFTHRRIAESTVGVYRQMLA